MLALAEQYLGFVEKAKALRIELAADYLVMAAWLAFLKSRLLLPPEPGDEGPSGEELAAHLAFQLERLAGDARTWPRELMARDQKGRDFFVRGIPEDVDPDTADHLYRHAAGPDAGLCADPHPRRVPPLRDGPRPRC